MPDSGREDSGLSEGVSETQEALEREDREDIGLVFGDNTEDRSDVLARIEEIEDEATREKLAGIFTKILAYDQAVEEVKHEAVVEVSEALDIPVPLLKGLELEAGASEEDIEAAIGEETVEAYRSGEGALENFADKLNKPNNLLQLRPEMGAEELGDRQEALEELYRLYTESPLSGRNELEDLLNEVLEIEAIDPEVQEYLDLVASGKEGGSTLHSEGAENTNSIFLNGELRPTVLKESKERHDIDFASVLWLMRNMHAMARTFNHKEADNPDVDIEFSSDRMLVYKDEEGNYKRLVKQEYSEGVAIGDVPEEVRSSKGYIEAWQSFLRHVNEMGDEHEVVPDITDSTQKNLTKRANINNTGNVFVRMPVEEGEKWKFTIIDPDVFDTKPGQHKFDPLEHFRPRNLKKKGFKGITKGVFTAVANWVRDSKLSPKQQEYIEKELARDAESGETA